MASPPNSGSKQLIQINRFDTKEENWKIIAEIDSRFEDQKEKLNNQKRLLIWQGSLVKVCRSENQQKMFFLFDDILVYASISNYNIFAEYSKQHRYPLTQVRIENIEENDSGDVFTTFGWNIFTPSKSFTVYANDQDIKKTWMDNLNKYINRQVRTDSQTWYAPVWTPEYKVNECHSCKESFTFVTRKHHCRSCGEIFCHACSDCKVRLTNISRRSVRVCRECSHKYYNNQQRTSICEENFDDTLSNSDSE